METKFTWPSTVFGCLLEEDPTVTVDSETTVSSENIADMTQTSQTKAAFFDFAEFMVKLELKNGKVSA